MRRITARHFDDWRPIARDLAAAGVEPRDVHFVDGFAEPTLGFDASPPSLREGQGEGALDRPSPPSTTKSAAIEAAKLLVPRRFLDEAALVACHRDADRFDLLYRLLFRLANERHDLLDDPLDDDVLRFRAMFRQVKRDVHKMHAFVRFRKIESTVEEAPHVHVGLREYFIAWHRPDHHIVRAAAPFFADRFAVMNWSILTPEESANWRSDERVLRFGPGVPREAAPRDDELEGLWRTYYGAIFNPARIKLRAMTREMPTRHWATLPETRIIPDLLKEAPARVGDMIERSAMAKKVTAADFIPPPPANAKLTLPVLAEAAQRCRGCDLCDIGAIQAVFGEGPEDAPLIMVGEQPGDQEDRAGRPFVGPAGQMLDEVLGQIGLDRSQVYVTNAVKHFKFVMRGKRRLHQTPNVTEVKSCRPWLEKEFELIGPKMVVALGATAARSMFGQDFRITQRRGDVFESPWAPWSMATLHPSALLRIPDPEAKAAALADFTADLKKAAKQLRKVA